MSAWCAAQGVKPHQLRYWLPVALREERGQEPPASRTGLAVRVGPAVVEVQSGFDRMLLTAVVRALMELC